MVMGFGCRCGVDRHDHGFAAVGTSAIDVVALLQAHLGNVGEADHLAVTGCHHQAFQFVDIFNLSFGITVEQAEVAGRLTCG